MELQENRPADKLFDILPCRHANPLERLTATADNYAFLGIVLDDDTCPNVVFALGSFRKGFHLNRRGIRDFLSIMEEDLLPDDFGDEKPFRLIADDVWRIERFAFRESSDDEGQEQVQAIGLQCRDGNYFPEDCQALKS